MSADAKPAVSFALIMQFTRQNWKKLSVFFVFSLVIAVILVAALYFLVPKTNVLSLNIGIQLPKENQRIVYPSKKAFSAADIISVPVLRRVYEMNNLSNKVKFNDFCQLFYLSGQNIEKAMLSASYKNKLNDKKISVIELKELEKEYTQALQSFDTRSVEIAMRPTMQLDSLLATKILNDIPKVWFELYSVQEAKVIPQFHSAAQVKELRDFLPIDGWLITLDKIRKLCNDLQQGCNSINEMLGGRQIALPSGEYLKELQARLNTLTRHRIGTVMQIVMLTPSYHSQFDRIYLNSNILSLTRRVNGEKAKYDATVEAINIIHPAGTGGKTTRNGAVMDKNSSVTMNFDGTFFTSLAELIRQASSIELREKYANSALGYKTTIAELEEERNYYTMLLAQISNTTNKSSQFHITQEQLQKIEQNMFDELTFLCGKLNEFKVLAMSDYNSSRQFFATSGEVLKYSQFSISIVRLIAGVFFLLILANFIFISKLFYAAYTQGKLKH